MPADRAHPVYNLRPRPPSRFPSLATAKGIVQSPQITPRPLYNIVEQFTPAWRLSLPLNVTRRDVLIAQVIQAARLKYEAIGRWAEGVARADTSKYDMMVATPYDEISAMYVRMYSCACIDGASPTLTKKYHEAHEGLSLISSGSCTSSCHCRAVEEIPLSAT